MKQFVKEKINHLMMSKRKSYLLALVAAAALNCPAGFAQHNETPNDFGQKLLGRWDLTVNINGKNAPSWIEVHKSGANRLVGYYVGTGGSARPVSKVNYADGKFSFTIPPQWESSGNDITVSGELSGDSLTGTILEANGSTNTWVGHRAPRLIRDKAPVWGTPVKLLNGKDLSGWTAFGNDNQWKMVNGVLTSEKAGANLKTNQTYKDFKLHVEFRVPDPSNSGVYLRGRYEVQVIGKSWSEPPKNGFSGVYGFVEPIEDASKTANDWQTYDITLVGRLVTIVANGKTVVSNQIIPGITGGALDSNEGEPGPIYLQGDHGPIEYRNIIITPAK